MQVVALYAIALSRSDLEVIKRICFCVKRIYYIVLHGKLVRSKQCLSLNTLKRGWPILGEILHFHLFVI